MNPSPRLAWFLGGLLALCCAASPSLAQVPSGVLRINAGGWPAPYLDTQGRTWAQDAFMDPVDRGHTTAPDGVPSLPLRARASARESQRENPLYFTARRGARIRYRVPAEEGLQLIRLTFVELEFDGPGQRLFDVQINGETALSGVDIFAEAGKFAPLVKEIRAPSRQGQVDILLTAVPGLWRNAALISAIEVQSLEQAALRVLPASVTLAPGESQQFEATGAVEPVSVKWNLSAVDDAGSIDESGLYRSPATIAGDRTIVVRAVRSDDPAVSAVAAVTLRSPVRISIAPEDPVVESRRSLQFRSEVRGAPSPGVSWSAASGNIGSDGLYTAPDSEQHGSDEVTATSVADPAARAAATVLVTPPLEPRQPVEYFVSPAGSPANDGSRERPWNLETALSGPAAVKPGDVVWLRGGVYGEEGQTFDSVLAGEPGRPVIVRQFPGERARVRAGLSIRGAHVWYWDFELFSDIADRSESREVPDGVDLYDGADHVKLINLVIHDRRNGVGLWEGAEGAEVYGCLIYHNGARGETRGLYHGIYSQNGSGIKRITDNIIFNQFGFGIQMYGSPSAFVQGYRVDGNVLFNNGVLYDPQQRVDNLLVGGAQRNPKRDIRITSNYLYHTPSLDAGSSRIGLNWDEEDSARPGSPNQDVTIRGNYWVGGQSAVELWLWSNVEFDSNTVVTGKGFRVFLRSGVDTDVRAYDWDKNIYYGPGQYWLNSAVLGFDAWRARTGFDAQGQSVGGLPKGAWTFLRPNRFDPDRGHLVIYNWDGGEAVTANLSDLLQSGDRFEVLDAQNFFGPPVVSGRYEGGDVRIPLTGLLVAPPAGLPPPQHTAPELGVFVVRRIAEAAAP